MIPENNMSIVCVKNVVKIFNSIQTVLDHVNLEIEENSFQVILGQSGSGKSTLINIMSGILEATEGEILIGKENIFKMSPRKFSDLRRNRISNIFQNYLLLPDLTIEENIKLGMSKNGNNLSFEDLVSLLGIKECIQKFPNQLSGGQQQRAAIARAIIKKPEILFCDEATGALDEKNSKQVVALLHEIREKYHITIIFSTHNLKIGKTADRIITLNDGKIVKDEKNRRPLSPYEINWGVND